MRQQGGGAIGWQRIDHASMRAAPSRPACIGALYDAFDAVGLQYGPSYRTLVHAWGGAVAGLARLRTRSTHEGTQVHPADLDDALCTSAVIASRGGDGETRLPFAVDDALLQGLAGELWAVRCCCDERDARGGTLARTRHAHDHSDLTLLPMVAVCICSSLLAGRVAA